MDYSNNECRSPTQHGQVTQTFRVGDTLFFNFTTGAHNVQEVSQSAYGPCTVANPISTETNGPATITLRTAGKPLLHIVLFGTSLSRVVIKRRPLTLVGVPLPILHHPLAQLSAGAHRYDPDAST
ncbi:cucumber peeling cupredoxin-like protein [Tanacetum coccineum]